MWSRQCRATQPTGLRRRLAGVDEWEKVLRSWLEPQNPASANGDDANAAGFVIGPSAIEQALLLVVRPAALGARGSLQRRCDAIGFRQNCVGVVILHFGFRDRSYGHSNESQAGAERERCDGDDRPGYAGSRHLG